jgi:hypothetical protein
MVKDLLIIGTEDGSTNRNMQRHKYWLYTIRKVSETFGERKCIRIYTLYTV